MISVRKQETLPESSQLYGHSQTPPRACIAATLRCPCQARGPEADDQRESLDLSCPPPPAGTQPLKARLGPWVRLTGLELKTGPPGLSDTLVLPAAGHRGRRGSVPRPRARCPPQRPLEERGSLRLCSSRARPACGHAAMEAASESPTRPQATAGPSPGTSEIQGRATAPLPTHPACTFPPSLTLLCPQAPKVPRHPHQQN